GPTPQQAAPLSASPGSTPGPTPPPGSTPPAGAPRPQVRPSRRPRRWSDLVVVSPLSAGLASGGAYAALELPEPRTTATESVAEDGGAEGPAAAAGASPVSDTPAPDAPAPGSSGAAGDGAGVAETVTPGTVTIAVAGRTGQGSGSGVVWDTEGHVVTNAHVVQGARQVQVSLADGRTYPATVVGTDPSSDLAVLQLSGAPDDLPPITV